MHYTFDKFIGVGMVLGTMGVIYYFIKQFLSKQDEMMTDFYRKKINQKKELLTQNF